MAVLWNDRELFIDNKTNETYLGVRQPWSAGSNPIWKMRLLCGAVSWLWQSELEQLINDGVWRLAKTYQKDPGMEMFGKRNLVWIHPRE